MLRLARGGQPDAEVWIRRARSARARKALARPGSAERHEAEAEEHVAIGELRRMFGVTTMTADALDWLIEPRSGR